MSGMIGVIMNDNARYSLFSVSLALMDHPPNTELQFRLVSDRIIGRNSLAKYAVDNGAEWLLFIDDDHVFPKDILPRLLKRDVAICGALYMQRQKPFCPIAYATKDDDGFYAPLDLTAYGPHDLVEVAAVGTGGCLIRSEVFHRMDYPYFEHGVASEDLMFCDRARSLNFPVTVDLGVRLGHMSPSSIWPVHTEDDGWGIGFAVADGYQVGVPLDAGYPPEDAPAPS